MLNKCVDVNDLALSGMLQSQGKAVLSANIAMVSIYKEMLTNKLKGSSLKCETQ